MAFTSFDRTARWLGPRRWGLLHRAGLHWLWFIFALNWTASVSVSLAYLPLALITGGLLALRLAAVHARRRGAEPVPEPA
jgi:methionine sulfoxide reductase heme-binding subunit